MATCYCYNCNKEFHHLGISAHRKAHLIRGEKVTIAMSNGDVWTFKPSKRHKRKSTPADKEKS